MKEVYDFLKLLYRHRLMLIAIPAVTVILAYFIVRSLPSTYTAHARMATGIVDRGEELLQNGSSREQSAVNQEFDNIVQMIRLKKILSQVSYQLILHDLSTPTPFREPSSAIRKLDASTIDSAIAIYRKKHQQREELSSWHKTENELRKLLASMNYDEGSLAKKLSVFRVGNSDYIDLEFTAEDPELSAFVINALCREFISYYTSRVRESNTRTVHFLDSLLRQKQLTLNGKMETLKSYKIHNRVLNLNEQAKSLYGQIADFETRKEVAVQEIVSYTAALKSIDGKFSPKDRRYAESALTGINQNIVATKEQLKQINDGYIKSNFDPRYKAKLDSLRSVLSLQINESSDKYIFSPLVAKENLVTQKLNMEVSLDLARSSVHSLDEELGRLNRKFDSLVPHEAEIQAYESGIDIAGKEYIEILQKFNQASLASGMPLQLRQIEQADPGELQASKKLVLVVFSGILSFVLCAGILFLLFLADHAIRDPQALADSTGQTVLGSIQNMGAAQEMNELWAKSGLQSVQQFKDTLRTIRFELESGLPDKKTIAITSFRQGAGKTFFAHSIAAAFMMTDKKVLIIDGDFSHPDTSRTTNSTPFLEDYLQGGNIRDKQIQPDRLNILTNKGHDVSLLEIAGKETVSEKLALLKAQFDIILIETAPLAVENNAREWLAYTDQVIAIFKSGETIGEPQKQQLQYLKGLGQQFSGWILNEK